MNLRTIMETVAWSDRTDWHVIADWVTRSRSDHSYAAAYIPNPSITLKWGLECNGDFQEPWANRFADPKAFSEYVDVFYNGAPVFRDVYVSVDGGRAYLPLPSVREVSDKVFLYEVPDEHSRFIVYWTRSVSAVPVTKSISSAPV